MSFEFSEDDNDIVACVLRQVKRPVWIDEASLAQAGFEAVWMAHTQGRLRVNGKWHAYAQVAARRAIIRELNFQWGWGSRQRPGFRMASIDARFGKEGRLTDRPDVRAMMTEESEAKGG